jgi:hypothetical protein
MIIVRISGGVGNQLFQYAAGRALALRNNDVLKIDTQALDSGDRPYALESFNIQADKASKSDFESIGLSYVYKKDLFSKILKYVLRNKITRETGFTFNPGLLKLTGNQYIAGLWQSEKYFADQVDSIRKELVLRQSLSTHAQEIYNQMQSSVSVSLHVRRGDYVQNPHTNKKHGACSPEYYDAALKYISSLVSTPHFFVFSDDIEWTKAHIKIDGTVTYVSGDNDITYLEELFLMSACKHNIIANSSFSWWSAWLNRNNSKTVIAPKKWMEIDIDTTDLVPSTWIRL